MEKEQSIPKTTRTAVTAAILKSHYAWRRRHPSPVTHRGVTETGNNYLKPRWNLHQHFPQEPQQRRIQHSIGPLNIWTQRSRSKAARRRQDLAGLPSLLAASPNAAKHLNKRLDISSSVYNKGPKSGCHPSLLLSLQRR